MAALHSGLPPGPGPSDWAAGELLRLYDTCTSFSKALGLTPFSLEDLVASLSHRHCEVVLVTSISMALLKAILSPVRRGDKGLAAASGGNKPRKPTSAKLLAVPLDIDFDGSGDGAGEEDGDVAMMGGQAPPSHSKPRATK